VARALPVDDFNDNARAATWSEIEDNAALVSIAEQNARLEAAGSKTATSDLDAIYLSDGPAGFALSAAQSFQMRIHYDLTAPLAAAATSGTDWRFALDFGFGTTAGGEDSFSAAVGWAPVPVLGPARGLGYAYRVNDVQTSVATGLAAPSGTLYVSYDQPTDTIRVSDVGYADPTPDAVVPNLVHGQWNATQLLVAFGARGHGADIAPGAAWLDDFVIDAGDVVAVPEPATASVALLAGAFPLFTRPRRRC
jgi:hypothetical protein